MATRIKSVSELFKALEDKKAPYFCSDELCALVVVKYDDQMSQSGLCVEYRSLDGKPRYQYIDIRSMQRVIKNNDLYFADSEEAINPGPVKKPFVVKKVSTGEIGVLLNYRSIMDKGEKVVAGIKYVTDTTNLVPVRTMFPEVAMRDILNHIGSEREHLRLFMNAAGFSDENFDDDAFCFARDRLDLIPLAMLLGVECSGLLESHSSIPQVINAKNMYAPVEARSFDLMEASKGNIVELSGTADEFNMFRGVLVDRLSDFEGDSEELLNDMMARCEPGIISSHANSSLCYMIRYAILLEDSTVHRQGLVKSIGGDAAWINLNFNEKLSKKKSFFDI